METHVLIPNELILKVRPSANCSSPSVAKLLEQQVSVTCTVALPKGWQIHPMQGTLRCGKLEVYSTLKDENVSHKFHRVFRSVLYQNHAQRCFFY